MVLKLYLKPLSLPVERGREGKSVTVLVIRLWQKSHLLASEAWLEKATQLLLVSFGKFSLRAFGCHVRGPATLRPACRQRTWNGHMHREMPNEPQLFQSQLFGVFPVQAPEKWIKKYLYPLKSLFHCNLFKDVEQELPHCLSAFELL